MANGSAMYPGGDAVDNLLYQVFFALADRPVGQRQLGVDCRIAVRQGQGFDDADGDEGFVRIVRDNFLRRFGAGQGDKHFFGQIILTDVQIKVIQQGDFLENYFRRLLPQAHGIFEADGQRDIGFVCFGRRMRVFDLKDNGVQFGVEVICFDKQGEGKQIDRETGRLGPHDDNGIVLETLCKFAGQRAICGQIRAREFPDGINRARLVQKNIGLVLIQNNFNHKILFRSRRFNP